jgi:putative PIN family toxin of toxin-antitoxin system
MEKMRIVIDTNVLISGLKSRRGASFKILHLIGADKFKTIVTVPLILEYEEILIRYSKELGLGYTDIKNIIDYICSESDRLSVYFLWRPILFDLKDEMVLEAAVVGNCQYIVTFNISDFSEAKRFGIKAITPKELLAQIGEIK